MPQDPHTGGAFVPPSAIKGGHGGSRDTQGDGPDILHAGREGLRVRLDPILDLTPRGLINENGFTMQCPPLEEFAVDHAYTHNDYDTANAGQFSRPASRQLRVI